MNTLLAVVTEAAADPDDFAALPVPESCRAIALRKNETELFADLDSPDKDPRKSMHLDLPYHVIGSDLAAFVVRTGPGVRDEGRRRCG